MKKYGKKKLNVKHVNVCEIPDRQIPYSILSKKMEQLYGRISVEAEQFVDGEPDGHGKVVLGIPEVSDVFLVIEGNFEKGIMTSGKISSFAQDIEEDPDDDIPVSYIKEWEYCGEMLYMLRHGNGKCINYHVSVQAVTQDGSWTFGEFVRGSIITNREIISGSFEHDWFLNGEGTISFNDGTLYKGIFKDGNLVDGEMITASGIILRGKFNKTKTEGEMYIKYPDGKEYKGTAKNGIPHGYGVMEAKQGSEKVVCKGEWADGCMHGKGTLTRTDGAYGMSQKGIFSKGMPSGNMEVTLLINGEEIKDAVKFKCFKIA